jgi:DHA1 family tetracycline resistance protein-like MFS transporter
MRFKSSMMFIFVTITLDMIGVGLIIPSLPDVIRRLTTDANQVSQYYGYFISVYAVMQFIASPLLGVLSDRWGRKPILLVSLCVAAIDYMIMGFAPSLAILFFGRVIAGLTGANITVAMAYTADVSTDENRAGNFGMMGAAFGLGFIIGPAIGGLLGANGPQLPFVIAAVMNLLNFIFGMFILPESLPADKRRHFSWRRTNPLESFLKVFARQDILVLMFVYFCFAMAGQTHPSIWTLYTEHRFDWTTAQVGLSLAMVGVLSVISQAGLTQPVVKWLGEWKTVVIGCAGYIFTFAAFGSATQGWMIYPILIFSALFWCSQPALQAMLTKNTPSNEQGELQGSLVSLTSLASILNPLIVTQLFAAYQDTVPGMPYYFAAGVSALAFAVALLKKH